MNREHSTGETGTLPIRRHAVWCLTLAAGSGDGSQQMIASLLAPRYQLRNRGIAFAASPRHADIVLISGAPTRHTIDPLRRVLAQVPEPHALVAIGDAFLHGDPFTSSDQIVINASNLLRVNIEVPGSPPDPLQILAAIESAARLLDQSEEDMVEDEEDVDNEEDVDDDAEDETPLQGADRP